MVISLITAALAFLSLRCLMALPMQTVTASLMSFRRNPEDYTSDIQRRRAERRDRKRDE